MKVRKTLRKSYRYLNRRLYRRNFSPLVAVFVVALFLVVLHQPSRQLFFGRNNDTQNVPAAQLEPSVVIKDSLSFRNHLEENSETESPDTDSKIIGTPDNPVQPPEDLPSQSSPIGYDVNFSADQRCVAGEQTAFGSVLFNIINGEGNFTSGTLSYEIKLVASGMSLDGLDKSKSFSTVISAPKYYYSNTEGQVEDYTHAFTYPQIPEGATLSLKLSTLTLHKTTRTVYLQNVCQ